ncbi:hypothetical protein ACH40E_33105 [Streptomyces acidicola]|uniref:hypothetical protein n=1 Tax=Streptomyces acidicola TaxID=2596892 RepID=UPI0037B1F3C4
MPDVRTALALGALLQVIPVLLLLLSSVRNFRHMPTGTTASAVPPAREGAE